MALDSKRLIAAVAIAALLVSAGPVGQDDVQAQSASPPQRIVSLVPALTEMLFAIGAGPQVVAISSHDTFPADVRQLPTVGALLDPDTERILALRPDLVITYGSQDTFESQLERIGIRVFSYRHGGLAGIVGALRELGEVTGHVSEADQLVSELEARLDAVRVAVAGRPRPVTMLVFERQPRELRQIYVAGGVGFLHDLVEIAGGENVFADILAESVQPSIETILARAPDVIVEARTGAPLAAERQQQEVAVWNRVSAVPAVRSDRVHFLYGDHLVVPGPRIAEVAMALARVIHPEAFAAATTGPTR